MIVFLNFAPIEFMGGAEKWMLENASKANKLEKVILMDVDQRIASLYGKAVLNRKFSSHIKGHEKYDAPQRLTLTYKNFIPFTKNWMHLKETLRDARTIYTRFELIEILIILYFGGLRLLRKTVAGMHLTFIYASPIGIFQKLHNVIYASPIYRFLLNSSYLVHVLNKRDKEVLEHLNIDNIVYVPNSVRLPKIILRKITNKSNDLNIIYVGELSIRKGLDTIIEVIKGSPSSFVYHIVGDGPMKDDIKALENNNIFFHGYVKQNELEKIYQKCDVILFPSRAEAFGLSMVEALSYGAKIVNSIEVSLGLPKSIEYSITQRDAKEYVRILSHLLEAKKTVSDYRIPSIEYFKKNFSCSVIDQTFQKLILKIN